MTPRSTDSPILTSEEALRLYLTGDAQDAPVRHHVVSRSYTWTPCLLLLSGLFCSFRPPLSPCSSSPSHALILATPHHSSSPTTKRNLKPSPTVPAQLQPSQYTPANEQSTLPPTVPSSSHVHAETHMSAQQTQSPTSGHRKRKSVSLGQHVSSMVDTTGGAEAQSSVTPVQAEQANTSVQEPKIKKSRTNTPWTPAEELRLKQMRDTGNSWSEIAKVCIDRYS